MKPHFALWERKRQRGEIDADMSFVHFLFLQALRQEDVELVAGRDLARFSQMVRNGIANPINKTVTYLTSQRQRDIYRVHVRDGMLFKDGGGGGGGGVNDCGEGGGNVDAGGGGASSSSSAAADPQQQLVLFSTDSYHTSWRVTGDGYAMIVFREAAGAACRP